MAPKKQYALDKGKQAKKRRQEVRGRESTAQGDVVKLKPPSRQPPLSKAIPWYKRRGNGKFFLGMNWRQWAVFTAVVSAGCAAWTPLLIKLLRTCRMNAFVSKLNKSKHFVFFLVFLKIFLDMDDNIK